MLKCCHLLSNILLLTSILILRLSTFMIVSHQEASGIAAKDASSKPWMTKHAHLHVQEEVKVMQMMGDDTEVNMMEPKLCSMEITCKCRHLVLQESRNPVQHWVSRLIWYFQLWNIWFHAMHNICCQQTLTNIHQNEACLWGRWCAIYICKLCNTCAITCVTCEDVTYVPCLPS